MALEAVVFPQDLFGYGFKDLYNLLGGGWSYDFGVEEEEIGCGGHLGGGGGGGGGSGGGGEIINYEKNTKLLQDGSSSSVLPHGNNNWDSSCSSLMVGNVKEQETNSSPETCIGDGLFAGGFQQNNEAPVSTRRKRRRTKSCKNKEEVENQRMTHIAVERNRRRQMNEYLAVLRSLMPSSYVQRGDQASIIGGAINFVKELEQLLQSLEAQKQISKKSMDDEDGFASPFADFFTFPQYSSCSTQSNNSAALMASNDGESVAENRSAIADIEVTMVESHANLKILSKRRPKQLLKIVSGFQSLRLTILHLNVTTVDQMVLYSFSVKVEEDCELTSVDEIATAVYQMLGRIQDEPRLS